MREVLLSFKTIGIALPLLVGAAVAIGEWVSPTIAYILFGVAFVWLLCAIIYWRKNKRRTQSKLAVGGLIGRANNVKVKDSHYKGKITIQGKSEDIDAGGLIGQGKNTEIVDSSADAEIEYKQDDGC